MVFDLSPVTVRLRYPDNTFPPREFTAAQALTATYLTTGVVFWGLVLTGLIDALLHARTVTEVHELREPPKDLGKEPATPAADSESGRERGTAGDPGPDKDGKARIELPSGGKIRFPDLSEVSR